MSKETVLSLQAWLETAVRLVHFTHSSNYTLFLHHEHNSSIFWTHRETMRSSARPAPNQSQHINATKLFLFTWTLLKSLLFLSMTQSTSSTRKHQTKWLGQVHFTFVFWFKNLIISQLPIWKPLPEGSACAAQKRSLFCWISRLGHYCQESVQICSLRALWFEISPLCTSREIDIALSMSLISFILY